MSTNTARISRITFVTITLLAGIFMIAGPLCPIINLKSGKDLLVTVSPYRACVPEADSPYYSEASQSLGMVGLHCTKVQNANNVFKSSISKLLSKLGLKSGATLPNRAEEQASMSILIIGGVIAIFAAIYGAFAFAINTHLYVAPALLMNIIGLATTVDGTNRRFSNLFGDSQWSMGYGLWLLIISLVLLVIAQGISYRINRMSRSKSFV